MKQERIGNPFPFFYALVISLRLIQNLDPVKDDVELSNI